MSNVVQRYETHKGKQHLVGMTYQNPHGTNEALYPSPAAWVSPAVVAYLSAT
jgi:hypothetical protein